MKQLFTFLILISFSTFGTAQNTAVVSEGLFQIDLTRNLILVNEDLEDINGQNENFSKIILDSEYEFSSPISEFEYGVAYQITETNSSEDYTLHFTRLPIISITTDHIILDEPRVPAYFFMSESDGNITESYIGIEYRGASSQSYPKKSLRIEFVTEEGGDEEKDVSLLGMREDGDWNIQAMFNEPLRFNNIVSFELWNDINQLYYKDDEPKAINGVRMAYVEVFLKGEYMGVYGLGERVDRKQLRLKKFKDGVIRGELYKGKHWDSATLFNGVPGYDNNSDYWAGFEVKYPKPDEIIDWENYHDFFLFILNSDDTDFYAEYETRLVSDNFIDYYIFLNLLRAGDNTGKNTFFARYTVDEPYFIVPWDLDGTFGVWWDGSLTGTVNDILSNNLFERLKGDCTIDGFSERLKNKWALLRQNEVTYDEISGRFQEKIDYLSESGAYEREYTRWHDNGWFDFPEGDPSQYIQDMSSYFNGWLQDRLDYLDSYFPTLCAPIATVENQLIELKVYPNPVSTFLTIESKEADNYKLFNQNGQKLIHGKLKQGINRLDLSHFESGVFFLFTEKGGRAKILKK